MNIPHIVELVAAKSVEISVFVNVTGPVAAALMEAARTAWDLTIIFNFCDVLTPDFFDQFADAVSKNVNLHKFGLGASHYEVADIAASRLVNVLGCHDALRSFSFHGRMSDGAIAALVESLCKNEHMREVKFSSLFGVFPERTVEQLKRLLDNNYTLIDIRIGQPSEQALGSICDNAATRNRSLWKQRTALQALKQFKGYGFATLASVSFRNSLLEYFLP